MKIRQCIEDINGFFRSMGFFYDDNTVKSAYLSLKTRPILIIGGLPGSGKSKLSRLLAEGAGATRNNGRMCFLPVSPEWSAPADLFGRVNSSGVFLPGEVLEFILAAQNDIDNPYFLILDEMNLSRPEFYLAPIISLVEDRRFEDGRIVTDSLTRKEIFGGDEKAIEKFMPLGFPENLFIIGTVNADSTDFSLSGRLTERANYMELSCDFSNTLSFDESKKKVCLPAGFLASEYLEISDCRKEADFVRTICRLLDRISFFLEKYNSSFSYRVRNEIVFFMCINRKYGIMDEFDAMDRAILQRILPLMTAPVRNLEVFIGLFCILCGIERDKLPESGLYNAMLSEIKDACKFPLSAGKLAHSVKLQEDDDFAALHF